LRKTFLDLLAIYLPSGKEKDIQLYLVGHVDAALAWDDLEEFGVEEEGNIHPRTGNHGYERSAKNALDRRIFWPYSRQRLD
jgi:hypothetical protein